MKDTRVRAGAVMREQQATAFGCAHPDCEEQVRLRVMDPLPADWGMTPGKGGQPDYWCPEHAPRSER